jgi:DNA gyrase subunit B
VANGSDSQSDEAQGGASAAYNASSIQVLEGLEAVRRRPAMYIGDTSVAGLHHLIWEVVDNSVDEALQGRCSHIIITVHKDDSVSVLDDGRGIPIDMHPKLGVPALEVIMTKLHAGGKFDKDSYQVSGGLHGVGVSVVNALSEWLEVEVYRNGKVYRQTFERGQKSSELAELGDTSRCGTQVRFKADPDIFEITEIESKVVHKRMRELAYLMGRSSLKISLNDEKTGKSEDLQYPEGLIDFVRHLGRANTVVHPDVIHIEREYIQADEERSAKYGLELALQFNDGFNENVLSFVNNINTHAGGTHLSGFKTALTRTFNQFAKRNTLVKDKEKPPSGDDLREGLVAVLSIKVPEPQFESQTKLRLGNREVEGIVNTIVGDALRVYLEENPRIGKAIFDKAMMASRAREAARKARDSIRRKSAMENSTLPLKLVDCQRGTPRDEAELFLVEGDSAGGTAVSGRAGFQAVLPLRGKILNVEKAPIHKVMDHREIEAIVAAVGTGFLGEEFDASRLRYDKIVIMTDADVDGSHIRTLLLTFFYRKMPELVRRGHVYVAQPPLYRLKKGKSYRYAHSEAERETAMLEIGAESAELRFDGQTRTGSDLEQAIRVIQRLQREVGLQPANDGYGLSDLARIQAETGKWPTHRIEFCSERVRGLKIADDPTASTFVTGGEQEMDEIVQRMTSEVPGLEVGFSSKADKTCDLVVRTIHLSKRFHELLAEAEKLGLPIAIFDQANGEELRLELKLGGETKRSATLIEMARLYFSRTDVEITRFKGLGEMDADQLWESAMDPERRLLCQVGYADEQDADELFRVLMGTIVEPRREFIEKHALEVSNLDI